MIFFLLFFTTKKLVTLKYSLHAFYGVNTLAEMFVLYVYKYVNTFDDRVLALVPMFWPRYHATGNFVITPKIKHGSLSREKTWKQTNPNKHEVERGTVPYHRW